MDNRKWSRYFRDYTRDRSYQDGGWKTYHIPASRILHRVKKFRNLDEVKTFLEIGSAGGFLVADFLKRGFDAYGIEHYQPIIGVCKAAVGRNIHGCATKLVFRKGYFDLIYATALCYLAGKKLEKAIREIYRVLDDEGIAIVDGVFKGGYFSDEYTKTFLTAKQWGELLKGYGFTPLLIKKGFVLVEKSEKKK